MSVEINGVAYPLKFGIKFQIAYEKLFGHNFLSQTLDTEGTIKMYHLALKTSAEKEGTPFNITVDELINVMDEDDALVKDLNNKFVEAFTTVKP